MKATTALLPLLVAALAGCAAKQPEAIPVQLASGNGTWADSCGTVFPHGGWQFIHAIDFSMPDGSGSTVIGVTTLTADGELGCALMTVEGLTLFEALASPGQALAVRRAVAPFDRPAFAEGLVNDVRFTFLEPTAAERRYGHAAGNTPVCRYTGADGRITDVLPLANDCWGIRSFPPAGPMDRTISGTSCQERQGARIPGHLELNGSGPEGHYTLKMTLISADPLTTDPR